MDVLNISAYEDVQEVKNIIINNFQMKVLVVEDDKVMQVAIVKSLTGKGYEALTADNGVEALSLMQGYNPDLIISDIKMPGISGLEFFNVLKQLYLKQVPLILISSIKKKDIEDKFKKLGVQYYIEKPINLNRLHRKIKQALGIP